MPTEMQRSRAIFSTQDFRLLREAVAQYIRNCDDPAQSMVYANLHHRLQRID